VWERASVVSIEGSIWSRKYGEKILQWGKTRAAEHPPHGVVKTTRHERENASSSAARVEGVPKGCGVEGASVDGMAEEEA